MIMYCPLTREECKTDCAWYVEGGCSTVSLNEIARQLDYVQDTVNTLEETIRKKNFIAE